MKNMKRKRKECEGELDDEEKNDDNDDNDDEHDDDDGMTQEIFDGDGVQRIGNNTPPPAR